MQTKKLLGSALALAMMWPGQASAELLKNLKMSGSFELQGVHANNVRDFATGPNKSAAPLDNRDEVGTIRHRIMATLDWDLLDDVHARTTLRKNNRVYGKASQDLNTVQSSIFLDEAFVKVDKVFGAIDATMGRQFVGTSGDIIAYWGPKEKLFGLPVDSIDAIRADWAGEMLTVSALTGKPDDAAVLNNIGSTRGNGEQDVRALLLGLRGQENIAAGAYLWNVEQHRNAAAVGVPPSEATDGGRNTRLWIAGAKAKVMMGPLWLGGEFAKNFGIQRADGTANTAPTASFTGWALMGDAGAKLDVDGVAAFTPWGQFAMGTGRQNTRENRNEDFQAVNPDFRPGIIYGRFANNATNVTLGNGGFNGIASNSLQNRVIWGLGVKVNPAAVNKLNVGVSYWDFRFHRSTRNPSDSAIASGQKHIGSEADLDVTWDHSDNVQFGVGAGRFMPGAFIQEFSQSTAAAGFANPNSRQSQQPVNPAYAAYFDVKIKFGGQQ